MSGKIPVLVIGDAPNIIGGLSRIARDITSRLHQDAELLGIEVAQAGIRYDGSPQPWSCYPLHDEAHWGKEDFAKVWQWHAKGRRGVVLSVWDPARCWELSQCELPNAELWGYFAVDSETEVGGFGGPAAEALWQYKRVLAYGGWGLEVLRKVIPGRIESKWLPHGLEVAKWENTGWQERKPGVRILGCVATNQPRKDLALLFQVGDKLRRCVGWEGLHLWLHTDWQVKYWSVPELAKLYGWNNERLLVTEQLEDSELARMYGACSVTLGVGRGEGFGYPLIESLACGTPVVHGKFGGGAEWIPRREWLVTPIGTVVEGAYGLQRPILDIDDVLHAVWLAGEEKEKGGREVQEYCKGAVKNLDWESGLWQRWRSWVKEGLRKVRGE